MVTHTQARTCFFPRFIRSCVRTPAIQLLRLDDSHMFDMSVCFWCLFGSCCSRVMFCLTFRHLLLLGPNGLMNRGPCTIRMRAVQAFQPVAQNATPTAGLAPPALASCTQATRHREAQSTPHRRVHTTPSGKSIPKRMGLGCAVWPPRLKLPQTGAFENDHKYVV